VRAHLKGADPEMPRPAAPNRAIEPPPLSMDEAAAALSVSRRWFQDFIKTIPPCWLAAGRRKLFDTKALEIIKEEMRGRARPSVPFLPSRLAKRSMTPGPRSALSEALAFLEGQKRGVPKRKP
jgi:hypothetical protein